MAVLASIHSWTAGRFYAELLILTSLKEAQMNNFDFVQPSQFPHSSLRHRDQFPICIAMREIHTNSLMNGADINKSAGYDH